MPDLLTHSLDQLQLVPSETPVREEPNGLLLATPDYFDVEYEINVHMVGNIGQVDKQKAQEQWQKMKQTYESLGVPMEVITSVPGLPDQVFPANLGVVAKRGGRPMLIPSHMASVLRQPEVAYLVEWAEKRGYAIVPLPDRKEIVMEGMGDVLWHPSRAFLYAGYGHRSSRQAIEAVQQILAVPVVTFELVDHRWYHLDTAFAPLNEDTVLIVPQAFTPEGRKIIHACFEHVIEVSEEEGARFVANGFSPDGKHFLVQEGSPKAVAAVKDHGFEVIELDTSEFLKSGGSVFCMKLRVFL